MGATTLAGRSALLTGGAPDIIGRDRSFKVCGRDGETLGLLDVEAALRILAGDRSGTAEAQLAERQASAR